MSTNDESIIVLTNDDGGYIFKGKNHPDNIPLLELTSDSDDADNEESSNDENEIRVESMSKNNNPTDKSCLAKAPQIVTNDATKASDNYWERVSLDRKKGTIKEWIDNEGLGLIFSEEQGLILFNGPHCYVGDVEASHRQLKEEFAIGKEIEFSEVTAFSHDYEVVSPDSTIRQAFMVWPNGTRSPRNLPNLADDETLLTELKDDREDFVSLKTGDHFTRLDLCKIMATVEGYLSPDMGILRVADWNAPNQGARILFSRTECHIFRRKIRASEGHLSRLLPVGLRLSVDAKEVETCRDNSHGVLYQACRVLAGTWPVGDDPIVLPSRKLTYAPNFLGNHGYFYCSQDLARRLKESLTMYGNRYKHRQYEYPQQIIRNGMDFRQWRKDFGGLSNYQSYINRATNRQYMEDRKTFSTLRHHSFRCDQTSVKKGDSVKMEVKIKGEIKDEKWY